MAGIVEPGYGEERGVGAAASGVDVDVDGSGGGVGEGEGRLVARGSRGDGGDFEVVESRDAHGFEFRLSGFADGGFEAGEEGA